ncbi:MAG: branched-chain amino acid transferase [Nocardioidaceae bacterium]|nr:branched-chain amino acid transferase [Nocardioidaceae bacterium]
MLELAGDLGVEVRVGALSERDLRAAHEVFATSTAGGIMPVTSIDGSPVGTGSVGELTATIHRAYWDAHTDPRFVTRSATADLASPAAARMLRDNP